MKVGNRPRVSGTNIELGYTQGASEVMSGTGWRYASYWYYPSSGTGDYLWWEARGDSGISPSPWIIVQLRLKELLYTLEQVNT